MLGGIEHINTGNDRLTRVPAEHRADGVSSPDSRQAKRFGRSDQLILSSAARSHVEKNDARYSSLRGLTRARNPDISGIEEKKQEKKKKISGAEALSNDEKGQVQELKRTDQKVRAHMASAGGYAQGGPSYDYVMGPDGKQYAVGGEVKIDTSPISDNPEATIAKAQVIRNAALAPAEPSGADMSVAAAAAEMEAAARREIQDRKTKENTKTNKTEMPQNMDRVVSNEETSEERRNSRKAENLKMLSKIFPGFQQTQGGSQLDIMA